ncbi:MAG: YodL domain-containing protein [Acutalibacteraceae bacterium]
MKIAIYQIAIERDENRLAFQSLNHIISVSNGPSPAELYDCVFAGEVSAQTLEDIFYVFNMELSLPVTKGGRSPVSDVVEIFLASGGSEFLLL